MKYVAPSEPQPIGGVLDDWLRLFRCSFRRCWPLGLLAALAGMALQLIVIPRPPPPGLSLLQYLQQTASTVRMPQVIVGDMVFWLIVLVVYGALLAQQVAVVRGDESQSAGDSLATGLRRLPSMLLGGVLLALILGVLILPAGISAGLLIGLHRAQGAPAPLLLGAVGILALALLLLYLSVRLEFWLPAIFAENFGGAASLGRSWRLVKGHWWRVTAITFVAGIIMWVLNLAIGGTLGLIGAVFAAHGHGLGPGDILYRIRFGAALALLARVVTMPLLTAVWLAIYRDLRLRLEGADLAARAEALGSR